MIKARLIEIVDRFKLTDIWKEGGISKPFEFAILTNEIYQSWSGMKASEYKFYKVFYNEKTDYNYFIAIDNNGVLYTDR